MKKNLEKKIQQYEDTIATRQEKELGIDFSAEPKRDIRQVLALQSQLKTFFDDFNLLKSRRNKSIDKLVASYFLEDAIVFDILLADEIAKELLLRDASKLKDYINEISFAIAYEKLKLKAIGILIDSTPNSAI